MKRRLTALFCAVFLCLSLLSLPASGADYSGIYFLAANDQFLSDLLTPGTMPVYSGGVIYVPDALFDDRSTHANLGLICYYNKTAGTVVLYNRQKQLLFDINAGTCRDQQGTEYPSARVILRNGRVFLPIRFVCTFFDFTFSTLRADLSDGSVTVFRVCNYPGTLDDAIFTSCVSLMLPNEQLTRYLREQSQPTTPTPTPTTPTPTPTPTPPGTTAPVDMSHISVSFAVSYGGGEAVDEIAASLAGYQLPAVFFFPPDALAEQDDTIRMLLGLGHQVGLRLTAEGAEEEFERGNKLLIHIARQRTRMVVFDDGANSPGIWVAWSGNIDINPDSGTSLAVSNAAMNAIAAQRFAARVSLPDTDGSVAVLSRLLRRLVDDQYTLRPVTETTIA